MKSALLLPVVLIMLLSCANPKRQSLSKPAGLTSGSQTKNSFRLSDPLGETLDAAFNKLLDWQCGANGPGAGPPGFGFKIRIISDNENEAEISIEKWAPYSVHSSVIALEKRDGMWYFKDVLSSHISDF